MPAIVKIGYMYLALKKESDAVAALKALAEAVQVRPGHHKEIGTYYYPEDMRLRAEGISVTMTPKPHCARPKSKTNPNPSGRPASSNTRAKSSTRHDHSAYPPRASA